MPTPPQEIEDIYVEWDTSDTQDTDNNYVGAVGLIGGVVTVLLVLWAFGLLPMSLNAPVRLR